MEKSDLGKNNAMDGEETLSLLFRHKITHKRKAGKELIDAQAI